VVPVIWADLAYVTWPLYRHVARFTKRPRLAAGLFTAAVGLGVGIPVAWVLVALASEATDLISAVRAWLDAGAVLPDWIQARPWLADRLGQLKQDSVVDPSAVIRYVTSYAGQVSGQLASIAGGLATNAFKFTITVLCLFFYTDGESCCRLALRTHRLPRATRARASGSVVRAVCSTDHTALVQGLIAGVGYAIFGVPSPVALGALTFVASFVPAGPALLWAGAAVWLVVGGHTTAAIGMAVYGLVLVSSIDNVLRPILISGGQVPIHFLVVFFGVLGGLASFGMLGLFLGPVLLSVTFALAIEFGRQHAEPGASA
jgi:predicted PurR-regulated permease PerM